MKPSRNPRSGFSLIEVLIASVIMGISCVAILACMLQSQKMMLFSKRFETAQLVLQLGEMAYPIPDPSQVTETGDAVLNNELLNVQETQAEDLLRELDMEMPRAEREQMGDYTFERVVDEPPDGDFDEILRWNGGIYAVRSIVRWGDSRYGAKREELNVIRLWRKKP